MSRARTDDPAGTVETGTAPAASVTGARGVGRHLSWVLACFFGLRVVLWSTGLRFHDHLTGQLQLIDEPILTANPFVAFTQVNIQPPLWNFYVGAVRAWSPLPAALTFQIVWVAADLATVLMLWNVLCWLGARRWQATVATMLVASNPLFISSESFLRYETAVTFLVTASVFTFARYVTAPSLRRFALFCAVLFIGVSTRTLLHPLWLLGGLAFGIIVAKRAGALSLRLVWPAALTIALVIGNLAYLNVRFGNTGYSSYVGMNLERIAVTTLPAGTLERLQREGSLSDLASQKPYSPYAKYERLRPSLAHCEPAEHTSALAALRKSTGEPNLNALCFDPIYRQAFDDSVAAIRAEPGNYLRSIGQAAVLYASWPAPFDHPSAGSFEALETLYKPILGPVHVSHDVGAGDPQGTTAFLLSGLDRLPLLVTVVGALVLALWRGATAAWRVARRRHRPGDETLAWIGFTVAAVGFASVAFDFYENARFRLALDPILLGPLVVAVTSVVRWAALEIRTRVWVRSPAGATGEPASLNPDASDVSRTRP